MDGNQGKPYFIAYSLRNQGKGLEIEEETS